MSGGVRMANNKIYDFHYDVTSLIKQADPTIPLYLYGHSMGGLSVTSYLLNNPALNISGVILSAPFLNFSEGQQVDEAKKIAVSLLAPLLDVCKRFQFHTQTLGILCQPRFAYSHDLQ